MNEVGILEDDPARQAEFRKTASELGAIPHLFDNAREFILWLDDRSTTAALISLDGDLFGSAKDEPGSGLDVARHLSSKAPTSMTVVVHSANRTLAAEMVRTMESVRWRVVRLDPVLDDGLDVRVDPVGWIRNRWKDAARAALARSNR